MSLIEIPWNPTQRQLRQFGCVCAVVLPLIVWWWNGSGAWIGGAAGIGLLIATFSFVAPLLVKPLFVGMSVVAAPIGIVVGSVALALIYYGLFFPMGMIMRLVGRDVLQRKINRQQSSYWEDKSVPKGPASYYRQS